MSKELTIKPVSKDLDLTLIAKSLRVSPETKKTYSFAMKSFKNYCDKTGTSPDIDSMLDWINSIDNSSTQATYIAAVKKVLNEVFKYDPRLPDLRADLENLRSVKKDLSITESGYLKKNEVDLLIKTAPKHIGVIIETLFCKGLRISELLNIKYKDCTLIEKATKNKSYYEIKVIGKRSKQNVVYINVNLFNKIKNIFYKSVVSNLGTDLMFHHNGKQYTRQFISMEIKRIGVLIGRPEIHAHTLRHSAACYLRDDRKLTIDKIQKFLNHSSAGTTMSFYLHDKPTPEEIGII